MNAQERRLEELNKGLPIQIDKGGNILVGQARMDALSLVVVNAEKLVEAERRFEMEARLMQGDTLEGRRRFDVEHLDDNRTVLPDNPIPGDYWKDENGHWWVHLT